MFNDKQLDAINSLEGRIRVIAGAGSGKTSVLTQRYATLIEKGINPASILCVTFTNKAANEMKDRIIKLVGKGDYLINTFHGFCLKILRENINKLGYPINFSILDADDQSQIIKKIYKDCNIDYDEITYATAKEIVSERKISTEDNLLDVLKKNDTIKKLYKKAKKEFKEDKDINYNKLAKNVIYYGYLYYQQKSTGLDFNDLIIIAVALLKQEKDILEKWQARLRYIMVDEFQDASDRQYELVSLLSKKHGNLFVVGDPDQTIYTWRGAKPEILVNFDKDEKTKTIIMNQNYRSTPNILKVANDIISQNELRVEKDLYTENPEGQKVWFRHFNNPKQEAKWLTDSIEAALKKYKPNEIAVLYRMHFLSRNVEEQLIRMPIPYIIYSGTNFYERKEIKDVLAYLKLLVNENDDLSFKRIVNVPTRGIGNKKIEQMEEYAEDNNCSMWQACNHLIHAEHNPKLEDFIMLIHSLKKDAESMSVYDLTKSVLEKSGYNELLEKSLEPEREQNIKELLRSILELDNPTLDEYLQQIMLLTNTDKKHNTSAITLMTIHSSKGLEFPVVYVTGMTEGCFPSGRAESSEQMEEERRLAYVAYTRAKERLLLSDSGGTDFNGKEKQTSRFVTEIEDEDLNSNIQKEEHRFTPKKMFVVKKNKEDKIYDASIYNPKCNIVDCMVADAGRKVRDRYSSKCHGQYFQNGQYYDWDDDTYLQGSIDAEDIFDEGDFC